MLKPGRLVSHYLFSLSLLPPRAAGGMASGGEGPYFGAPIARNSGSMAATVIRCVDVDEPVRGAELSSRRLATTTGFFQPSTCHYYGVSGDRERTSIAKQWPGEGGVRVRRPRGLVTFRWRLQEARFRKQSRRKDENI